VPGHHNVLNSLAAVAVGLDLGVPFAAVQEGLAAFAGVDRRFQLRGEAGGITVIDDYGHHPTEIRATLETLRGRAGTQRTVVLFQPHRYSRTQALWDDFCRAFHLADLVVIMDIYPAGEEPIDGISAETLADAIGRKGHRHAVYGGDMRAAIEHLLGELRDGDVVLTLGAGSVWTAGDELLRRRAESAGGAK
jgi:UDP-N-acetylmuramate--alanine ligase